MESIAGTLGLNVPGFLWHTFNFIILLVLLWFVLFKPVTRLLDERAERVRDSMEQAETVRRQTEQAEADRQALLAETRRDVEQIRARADEQAKRIITEAQESAQVQADRIIERAQADLEASRVQMMAEVRTQVADLVVTAVDRVTRQALDAPAQQRLIEQFLQSEAADGAVRVAR